MIAVLNAAGAMLLAAGVDPAPAISAAGELVAALEREVEALRGVVAGSGSLALIAVVLLGWALAVAVSSLLRVARRTGYGGRRPWFARVQLAATAAVALVTLAILARILLARAPFLSAALLAVFFAGALLSLAIRLHQLTGGAFLVVRGRVGEGDHVRLGDIEGTVERVGLTRLHLRAPDGSSVYLPTSLLDTIRLRVAHQERWRVLEFEVYRGWAPSFADCEAARRVALLCPYRVLDSEVEVRPTADRRRLTVRLHVWGEAALREAELSLRHSLEAGGGPS